MRRVVSSMDQGEEDKSGGSRSTLADMSFDHAVHHLTLSVTDLERSTRWYCEVLHGRVLAEREGAGFTRRLIVLPSGLVIGLTQHLDTAAGDRFDHRRVGLDHLSLAVATPTR